MTKTWYKNLLNQIQALAPMCNFEIPEILCTNEELYYRDLYKWTNGILTDMINLASGKVSLQ